MPSSRSSRSKKAEGSTRVKLSRSAKEAANGTDDGSEVEEIEIESDSENEESSASEKPSRHRSRDSSINKAMFSMPDDVKKLMERITCCSCGKQLNPQNPGAVRRHPWLKVITCKKCFRFLRSGPFTRDEDGLDEQCRWCGEGGRLYGCDFCNHCFCRTCIKRNLGRTEAANMENDDDSKWHCYMCKPKKIKKLVEDCDKILEYIEAQEKKEKEREERAKQREKEKSEKMKENSKKEDKTGKEGKDDDKGKEKKDEMGDKSTPKKGFPAPRSKNIIAEKLETEKKDSEKKNTLPVSQSAPDLIVVGDSPAVQSKKHHRAVEYKPDVKSGVTKVQKTPDGITEVHVGPKLDKPVVVPIVNRDIKYTNVQRPYLMGILSQTATPQTTTSQSMGINRGIIKVPPATNDIRALKSNILPYNIDNIIDRLGTVAQSLSLSLNSAKTDLAIANLSQSNMHQARQIACHVTKNSVENFFNAVREIFNVQVVTNFPQPVSVDSNKTDLVPNRTSTPDSKKGIESLLRSAFSAGLNESAIPIEIDDASPVKKPHSKDKMDRNSDDVVFVSDSDTKEVKPDLLQEDKEQINGLPEDSKQNDKMEDEQVTERKEDLKEENEKPCSSTGDGNVDNNKDKEAESECAEVSELGSDIKEKNENRDSSEDDKSGNINTKNSPENSQVRGRRSSRSASKSNDKDSDNLEEDTEVSAEVNVEKEGNTRSSRRAVKNKQDDSEETTGVDDSVDLSSKSSKPEEKFSVDKSKKGDENDTEVDIEQSENEAAELELLKEMEDELNTESETELRRSSRNRKKVPSESVDVSDKEESPVRRSSRRVKLENDTTENELAKGDKKIKEGESKKKESSSKSEDTELSRSEKKGKKGVRETDDDKTEDDERQSEAVSKKKKSPVKVSIKFKPEKKSDNTDQETDEACDRKGSKNSKNDNKGAKKGKDIKSSEDSKKKEDQEIEESDTTETTDSDENVEEFGKRKKNRKAAEKSESRRETRQKYKKVNRKTEDSDSDPDFDKDLEKDIKNLSKETRLSRRKAKEEKSTKEPKEKKEKTKGDQKKKKKDDDDKDSSDSGEDSGPAAKKGKKSETVTEQSDSDSDFDVDLEKEIQSLSKETRLSKKKAKQELESKKKPKGKVEKAKEEKKGKKSKKGTDDDDDDDDSDSSDVEDMVPDGVDEDSTDVDTDTISQSQLKKLRQAGKAALAEESDEDFNGPDDMSDDSSDPEVSFPKMGTPKKGKKGGKHKSEVYSDDSDFVTPKKRRKRIKNELLDAKISDSDSDNDRKGKKGKGKKGKGKRKKDESDQFSELSDEEEGRKRKGKKRRRIKKVESSEEEAKEPGEDDDLGDEDDDESTPGGFLKRKQIRKVKSSTKLQDSTKAAQKAEEERRRRIEDRQKEYNTYVEVEGGEEEEELPEGTEREMSTPTKAPDSIAKILGTPKKIPITTKCVLEIDKETKKPLIEVDKTLIRKLKPHQVEAVRFIYNCCVESMERLKKGEGSGCILAHCMGLGKTLSVITFIHTMLSNKKLTKMSKCLVVCPLNTVLNWVNEFEIWLDDVDFEIEVYEMSKVKQNFERAQMLKEWHEGGPGVMIMGYDMYRNLVMGSHCKNKKQKKIFYETLADPGPDIVVCDEGHVLKNDATSLSKSMTKIISPRRIVLTGTPLQNNLGEYHCMVSFVKPALLGTRKEFNNRFANPITNGQCSDSTPYDVKLMKRRAHILHELLAGCVQRKDYSALTKFLPPKFEYVISVRLSKVQMTLYQKYLDMVLGGEGVAGLKNKGARLFVDYQALMRIWTHPWVLKLDEIRQENKRMFDDEDEDSFIDDSDSEEDSFIDDSTTSGSSSSNSDSSESGKKKKKGKGRKKKGSSSSDEDSSRKKDDGDEVVKKWKSKRRGNEEGAGSSWMDDLGYAKDDLPKEVTTEWWAEFVKEEDEFKLELSGKLTLMFEILKMCEDIGDKVLVFSQSLLSLDIIEDFLAKVDEAHNQENKEDKPSTSGEKPKENGEPKENKETKESDEAKPGEEKPPEEKTAAEKNKERLSQYGKTWVKGADYFRMDGSTNSQNRKASQDMFNDVENYRARLFLISTKAGSLGINLVAANRVIIFDASWNPSHDIQSIFRVYRFGQVKPVYVYRFLAQGTMEEKIYERQVTKQSLSQRVVDEHQIERHFSTADLQELYRFTPDRLDDPEKKDRPLPMLPKDHMLAELMTHNKEWIVTYHEHDSLLENLVEQELTEEEKKAAWEDYENEKKGISRAMGGQININPGLYASQQMNMQNLLLQGQANLGQAAVLQIVQDLKARFPNLPPEVFQQRVQAVLRQVLTQQIMQQSEMQRRQVEQQRMAELQRLNQIKQQIQRQQAMISNQQRAFSMGGSMGGVSNPIFSSAAPMNYSMGGAGIQSGLNSLLRPQTSMNQQNAPGQGVTGSLNSLRQQFAKK